MTGKENNLLIIGLGNPGIKYDNTYHNLGFITIDLLAKKINANKFKKEGQAEVSLNYINGDKIVLAKPTTFMNLSGVAVKELSGKYIDNYTQIMIIVDDVDIPQGTLRVRKSGSGGTHNGMRNIVQVLSSNQFPRLRIGMGGDSDIPILNKVLSKIDFNKEKDLKDAIELAANSLVDYIDNRDIESLMQKVN